MTRTDNPLTVTMRPALALLLLACAGLAQAQLFKWADTQGKVHYTDAPPPPSARILEKRSLSAANADALPFELAEAVRNNPVVLYTTPKCPPCEQARAMLAKRGVPYTEKIVATAEDLVRLRQAGGEQTLPFLTVGRMKQSGFEPGAWDTALTAAQYPANSRLPRGFQAATPEPAAPVTRNDDNKDPAAPTAPSAPLPAAGTHVPPGFRF
jgi:glutaredoxin